MTRHSKLALGLLIIMTILPVASVLAVYGDIVFRVEDESRGVAATVFPHWAHRVRYKCYACHNDLFEMEEDANAITMKAIEAGEYCGACHNGKTAWGIGFDTCNRCHSGE